MNITHDNAITFQNEIAELCKTLDSILPDWYEITLREHTTSENVIDASIILSIRAAIKLLKAKSELGKTRTLKSAIAETYAELEKSDNSRIGLQESIDAAQAIMRDAYGDDIEANSIDLPPDNSTMPEAGEYRKAIIKAFNALDEDIGSRLTMIQAVINAQKILARGYGDDIFKDYLIYMDDDDDDDE